MIIPTTVEAARAMTDEFFNGTVQKEYVARCWGEFPVYVLFRKNHLYHPNSRVHDRGEVVCEEPLLTVDRQMGLNIVHPEGKVCKLTSAPLKKAQCSVALCSMRRQFSLACTTMLYPTPVFFTVR